MVGCPILYFRRHVDLRCCHQWSAKKSKRRWVSKAEMLSRRQVLQRNHPLRWGASAMFAIKRSKPQVPSIVTGGKSMQWIKKRIYNINTSKEGFDVTFMPAKRSLSTLRAFAAIYSKITKKMNLSKAASQLLCSLNKSTTNPKYLTLTKACFTNVRSFLSRTYIACRLFQL